MVETTGVQGVANIENVKREKVQHGAYKARKKKENVGMACSLSENIEIKEGLIK